MTAIVESKLKPGYKETEVGVIPDEWGVKIFGECFKHLRAYTFSRNQLNYDEKENAIYNIHYGDIHSAFPRNLLDVKKDIDLVPIIINPELETPELLKDGDLIMADASEDYKGIGQSIELINVGDKKIVSGTHTFPLRPIEQFAPKYAGYIFSSYNTHKEIKRIATGISVYGISKSNIAKIQLPIPPLPEQKAIADCLSTWDKGIENLSALIASKKEQKKGLMQQLLTGNKRLDGFKEEWKEVRLGKYFKERNQRGFNDLDLLSIGAEGVYPQLDSNKKDTSNADKSKYKLIEIGDLGYNTMRLWQGRIALSNMRGIVSPAYTILIPQIQKVNSHYFSYLFKMPFVVNKFYRNSQGMVSDTLTCRYNDFKKIKLFIPSIEEQVAIAKVVTTAEKEIKTLEKKLETFKSEKKGLMQVLLTGERRLRN